jgi:glycosyltransferase involved in cell wall biosynthesis
MLLNWYSGIGQGQGYSGATENILVELGHIGYDVRILTPKKVIRENLTEEGLKIVDKPFMLGDIGVYFGYPAGFNSVVNKYKIGFTMFETSKLPNGKGVNGQPNDWAGATGNAMDFVNSMDELWLPCQQNVDVFRAEGATTTINKVVLGVNRKLYYDMSEKRAAGRANRPFTFLMLGTLTSRKNVGAVILAFIDLFKDNKDVQLILKSSSGTLAAMRFPEGANIKIIDEYSTIEQVQGYYANADAFIFPSRGEGFGLPPLEAMATGLPTIFTDNTGMSEYADSEYNYPIKSSHLVPAITYPKRWGNVGEWYEADMTELKAAMLNVFENEDKSKAKGQKAAKWVAENWTYANTAKIIDGVLRKIAV